MAARPRSESSRRTGSRPTVARGPSLTPSDRNRIMSDIIETLLLRNLQEVFGEGDPAHRRAAIEELYAEDCTVLLPIGRYVGHQALDQVAGELRAVIRASSTHRTAPRKRFRMGDASRGDPDQPASRPATLGSTSLSSATGRSPPYTSSSTRCPYEVGHRG